MVTTSKMRKVHKDGRVCLGKELAGKQYTVNVDYTYDGEEFCIVLIPVKKGKKNG